MLPDSVKPNHQFSLALQNAFDATRNAEAPGLLTLHPSVSRFAMAVAEAPDNNPFRFNNIRLMNLWLKNISNPSVWDQHRYVARRLQPAPDKKVGGYFNFMTSYRLHHAAPLFPDPILFGANWMLVPFEDGLTRIDYFKHVLHPKTDRKALGEQAASVLQRFALDGLQFFDVSFLKGHNIVLNEEGQIRCFDHDSYKQHDYSIEYNHLLWLTNQLFDNVILINDDSRRFFSAELHFALVKRLFELCPKLEYFNETIESEIHYNENDQGFKQAMAWHDEGAPNFELKIGENGNLIIRHKQSVRLKISPDFIAIVKTGTTSDFLAWIDDAAKFIQGIQRLGFVDLFTSNTAPSSPEMSWIPSAIFSSL